jgi:hypothetical protein
VNPSYCEPGKFNPDGCLYWSPEQIIYPYPGELNTMFITTRVSIYQSPLPNATCSFQIPTTNDCAVPTIQDLKPLGYKTYYIANVEQLTFQVDHRYIILTSVRTQLSYSFGSVSFKTYAAQNMVGKLISSCTSKDMFDFDEKYRADKPFGTSLDIITMQDLLDSSICAGDQFGLSRLSVADGAKPGEDLRSSGFVISAPISYTNRQSNSEQLKYQYLPAMSTSN